MKPAILPYGDHRPRIAEDAFVAPTASVIGDVHIGAQSSIWFGCTVRGDVHSIRIGARTNIQDGTVIHVSRGTHPTEIGDDVLVGHMCLLHGCTLEDRCFVGMGAVVMDGVVVETGAMVAAGALVTPGKRVRSGQLWGGRPARHLRDLEDAESKAILEGASSAHYVGLAADYREMLKEFPENGES